MKRFLCWLLGHVPGLQVMNVAPGGRGTGRRVCARCGDRLEKGA